MRCRDVANTINMFTVGISAAFWVGTCSIRPALSITMFRTIGIRAAVRDGTSEILCTDSTITTIIISTTVSWVGTFSIRSALSVALLSAVLIGTAPIIVTLSVNIAHSITSFCAVVACAALWVETCPDSTFSNYAGSTGIQSTISVLLTALVIFTVAWCHASSTKATMFAGCVVANCATLSIFTLQSVGPVAHRTKRELESRVKSECPLVITHGNGPYFSLTARALKQAGLHHWATLPEPAAVRGMFMIEWPFGLGIYKFTAVRDHTAIVGQALSPWIVGHSVALGG